MKLVAITRVLEQSYNKIDLENALKTHSRIFIANNYDFLVKEGVSRMELELSKAKSYTKETLVRLCAVPFANKAIFLKFRESLIPNVRKVFDALIWVDKMHQDEIKERLGVQVYIEEQKTHWNNYVTTTVLLIKDFQLFATNLNTGWYNTKSEHILGLPLGLRRALVDYYERPTTSNFIPLEITPTTTHIYTSGEKDILTELSLLIAYSGQGQIAVTGKGRPSLSTIGKMQKKLNLQEFFPNSKDKPMKNLRSMLLAGLVVVLTQRQVQINVAAMLKEGFFQHNYPNRFESLPIILHYIKGVGYLESSEIVPIENTMMQILKSMPVGKWVSYENFDDYLRYNIIEIKPISEQIVANKLYFEYQDLDGRFYSDRHYIKTGSYRRAIVEPFIKGTMFMFAAFGLLDIAYDEADTEILGKSAFSPYDKLKYIRLTPLGFYVTGNTTIYVPPKGINGTEIKLSENSLTMLIESNDDASGALLEPYAERISPSRYQTDFR
ncbi:MAG: hypothetical protein HC892_10355, partial [Saprospiraceae bacterium]|nr:hypothetical protein [Saprospiraceae bacterium]